MSSSKGGVLILAVAIFGAGYLAAPEMRTVTETKVDFVAVRIPDTKVVTKNVTQPMPESCIKVISEIDEYKTVVDSHSTESFSSAPLLISDARKAIYDNDLPRTSKSIEDLGLMKEAAFAFQVEGKEAKARVELALSRCKSDLE